MSYAVIPIKDYVDSCDTIREKTGSAETIKSGEMPDKINDVFKAGQLDIISNAEALKGSASGSSVTIKDISPVEHDVPCKVGSKNLFDKNNANIIVGLFSNSGEAISPASTTRSVYISCKPNTTYTISKMLSARFFGGFTSEIPNANVIVSNVVNGGSGTKITITSASDSKYLIIYLYHSSHDTAVTLEQILESLQIEIGTIATAYTPHIEDISTVKVQRLGKNLFDPSKFLAGSGWKKTNDGVYYGNSALLYAVYKKSTNNPIVSGVFKESTRYTISFLHRTDTNTGGITFQWEYTDGTIGDAYTSQNKSDIFELRSTTSKAGKTVKAVYLSYGNTSGSYFKDVQLEEGATTDRNRVTEFEPYNCTEYTANADGIVEGIKSLYPTTTLMTDTEGVNISAEYIKDIDKTFNSLTTAVALTGGE